MARHWEEGKGEQGKSVSFKGITRLTSWFDSGRLIRPNPEALNLVDLSRALASLAGAEGMEEGPGVQALIQKIGPAKHYIFLLVDGLGMNQIQNLPENSLFRMCAVEKLQTVFISTTATALTTIATGHWPSSHGIPGWWTYLERPGISVVTLPFRDRHSGKSLKEFGLTAKDLFPLPSYWPQLTHEPLSILPIEIVNSTYSKYASGETARIGYSDLANAIKAAQDSVVKSKVPTFTYVYLPQFDTICHKKGVQSGEALKFLMDLDQYLKELCESLAGQARIVVSSDHGQVDIPKERRFNLEEDDPLVSYLLCHPSGEPNVPILHVRHEYEALFEKKFIERFGEYFILLTAEEIESLRLFGPTDISPIMKQRLGTFLGISQEPAAICIGPPEESGYENIGFHGGLSDAEMYVPLIMPD